MLKRLLKRLHGCLPRWNLRGQLAASFFVIPLLVGIFLYAEIHRYGEQILEASSDRLMRKSRDNLFGRIDAYFSLPESIVRLNGALGANGTLPLDNEERLGRILLDQVVREPSVDFLYYASEAGGMVSAGISDGRYVIASTAGMRKGDLVVDQVDAQGRSITRDKVVHGFDPRQRGWYRSAKAGRRVFWTEPYAGTFEATLAISTAYPVTGPSGEVLGVFGADILLNELASFLHSLEISPHGFAFLTESNGTLVATSSRAAMFESRGQELVRTDARTSRDPLIREAALVADQFKRSGRTAGRCTFAGDGKGNDYYMDVSAYRHGDDIKWFLVVAVPRADLAQALEALVRQLLVISVMGLMAALLLSWGMGKWITSPIQSMKDQVGEVASGHFGGQVTIRRADEIGDLGRSFNGMSAQLAATSSENARLLAEEREARAAAEDARRSAEEARRRSAFLAEAGALLGGSLDYEETLSRLGRLCVQSLADTCVLDLVEGQEVRRVARACSDPAKEPLLESLRQHHPVHWDSPHAATICLRTGEPILIPEVTDDFLRSHCDDEEHVELIRAIGTRSAVVVPLVTRHQTLGVFTLGSSTPGRYGPADFELAQEVARRAASAIDNARLYREVQRADQRKSDFIAVLSHELRNPLAPIRTGIQFLRRSSPDSPVCARAWKIVERQTGQLTRLVDDLLDVTRISRGKIDLQRARVDLRDVVRAACDDLRLAFERGGVELRLEPTTGPVWVEADATRLSQVVGNLLNNAAKFTPAGGNVVASVTHGDGRAEITVRDTGVGMKLSEVERMFEPFAQAEQGLARTQGGLGLGLALAKGLVELHGGSIEARSEGPGLGAEFRVLLPLASAPVSAMRAAPPEAGGRAGGRIVLLIDDNVDTCESLSLALGLTGQQVRTAHDGRSGIAAAHELRPDVVLCDIGLPDIDGYEVARMLRADEALRSTRLIALSGYARPEDKARAKEAGFDTHVAKPPELDELTELLAR